MWILFAATTGLLTPRLTPTLSPLASSSSASPTQPIHVKIDGQWYDCTEWAAKHPGGKYLLEWADGFDVTGAFHSIHLFSGTEAKRILAKMPPADLSARAQSASIVPRIDTAPMESQQPTFMDSFMQVGEEVVRRTSPPDETPPAEVPVAPAEGLAWQSDAAGTVGAVGDSALKRDLEEMLRRHFRRPADYKATPEHWLRIAGALALWALCFAGWVHGEMGATLLLPYAQWLVFSPTVHEASHSTLSTVPMVNKAAAFAGLPFIYNPYIWWAQHILSHHQYTNDDALDVDLHHLRPARLHPGCEVDGGGYSGFNFIFKGYFSTLGMSVLWPIRVLQGKSTGRWYENLVTPKPDAVGDAEFALSLLLPAFALLWPWARVAMGDAGALEGFFHWFYPWAVTGAIWTVMTQVSHVQADCQRPPTGDADDWFRWQIESAVDYSVGSSVVPKLTASLSLQSMHHVLPSVCGCHFHALRPDFEEICARHGVRLNTRRDVSDAWRTAIRRVFELSSPDLTPHWTSDAFDAQEGLARHAPLIAYLATPAAAYLAASAFF